MSKKSAIWIIVSTTMTFGLKVWDDYMITRFYMENSCEKMGSNVCYPHGKNHKSYSDSGKSMIDRDEQFLAKQTSMYFLYRINFWGRSKYYDCFKI